MRARLPNRRASEIVGFSFAGMAFTVGFSRFPDGRPAEIFIDVGKPGSAVEAAARDAAIAASLALQFGCQLETLRKSLTADHNCGPASPLGAAIDAIGGGQ